jgi:DNA-binding transcriptional LysR family regulator
MIKTSLSHRLDECFILEAMEPNLESGLLLSFVAVAETSSFTAAGLRVGRSQSAVSLQIRRLETMLGCRLFERSRRRVALTRAGSDFLIYARRILLLHREAAAAVNPALGETVVRVGMPNDYAELFLPALLRRFETEFPRVRCDIQCDMTWELLDRLDRGELDLVLGIRHAARSTGLTLCHEEIVWVAGPAFDPASVVDRPLPLVLYPERCPYRARGTEALAGCGREWRVVYTSQSPTGIRIAVEERGAVTLTSRRTVPPHWRVLSPAEGFPALPPAELQLYRVGSSPGAAVESLARQIREAFAVS